MVSTKSVKYCLILQTYTSNYYQKENKLKADFDINQYYAQCDNSGNN